MKRVIQAMVERTWAAGFALAGRIWSPQVEWWSSPGGQRVLVVAPHPDDEAIGCAGTIVRHRQGGDEVCIVVVTDGRLSRALGLTPEEMVRRRRKEAAASAQALGVENLDWLGLPEGKWNVRQLQEKLQPLVRDFSPEVIYAPSRVDFHPEHHRVAYGLGKVLTDFQKPSRFAPQVRVYQVQVPLTPLLTNLVADASGVAAESETALNAYASQSDNLGRALRQRHYAARFYGCRKYAEEFWQMTADQYGQLHQQPPKKWPTSAFRGLRARPLSDPLAYMRGQAARRCLWRRVTL